MVVMYKYVQNKSERFGYVTGLSFANQLGLTTQMSAVSSVLTGATAKKLIEWGIVYEFAS